MILLVNQHTVPVFTDVVNAFANSGHEARLFTGHIEAGNVPVSKAVRIVKATAYNRTSTVSRFLSWSLFSIRYFFYLLFCKKPSHIVVVTNPPVAPFMTAIVAGLRGIPFYIVVFDLYPEALRQAGLSSNQSWLYKVWQLGNRWTFSKANGLITLSESMKAAVVRYVDADKVNVISNWADTNYIHPMERKSNPFTVKHGLQDKFVVMYSGNMGLTHDLESLMDAAAILVSNDRIAFVLIGEGGKRKKLESVKEQKHLNNVLFLPYQDATMFPYAMAAADVGIVTLGTGAEGISVPSKTYVNMAAGLAIIAICPAKSELSRIVQHFAIGHVVTPGEPEKIVHHISALASDGDELAQFKARSRQTSLRFTSANASQYVTCLLGS